MTSQTPIDHRFSTSDNSHHFTSARTQRDESLHDVSRTYSSSDDPRHGQILRMPDNQGSIETEPFIRSSEATRMRGNSESTLTNHIATSTNSLESQHLNDSGHAATVKAPPLWRIWWPEVACITLSIIALIIIVLVLSKYDQRSLPKWPLQITLNSVVALFTTIAKACFMIPVSVAISQVQWSWFLRDKPLYDFHVLDQASRGSWGSLILLTRVRWRHFVVVGALLTIMSALTSPVTQLAINYPVRDVSTQEGATVAAVHTTTSPGNGIDRRSRTALVLGTISNSIMTPLVTCATGNCTFNSFESLGICLQMTNITSQLRIEKFENPGPMSMPLTNDPEGSTITPGETIWKASLPGRDYELAHQTNMAALSDMLNWSDTSVFRNESKLMQTRIASMFLIYTTPVVYNDTWQNGDDTPTVKQLLTGLPEFRHEAMEFIFHLCVQSFETKIRKGEEKTDHISSLAEPVEQDPPFELKMNCTSLLGPNALGCVSQRAYWNDTLSLKGPQNVKAGNPSSNFTANYRAMEEVARAMKMYLPGYGRATFEDAQVHFGGGSNFFENFVKDVLFTTENVKNTTLRTEGIRRFYERIAVHLSATLREVKPNGPQNSFNISGTAWREEAFVQVKWGWITFLAAEVFAAAIFLSITVTAQISDREGNWSGVRGLKNSALAPLLALSDECRVAAGGGLQHMDELKEKAIQLKVRLEGNSIVPAEVVEHQRKPRRRLQKGERARLTS